MRGQRYKEYLLSKDVSSSYIFASLPSSKKLGSKDLRVLQLFQRDGDSCIWCSKNLHYKDKSNYPTIDHFVTQREKGSNWIGNLVLSCKACNQERGHLQADKWYLKCKENKLKVQEKVYLKALQRSKHQKAKKS